MDGGEDGSDLGVASASLAESGGGAGGDHLRRIVIRVITPGRPAFQLQKGEAGLSVFDLTGVSPPLTDPEILRSFRPGSITVARTIGEIESAGLSVVATPGDPRLPVRLQQAHAEIVPGAGMTRGQFKTALKGLE